MRNAERIVVRCERAGGELSEAAMFADRGGAGMVPVRAAIGYVNLMTADLRRAVVRIEQGEPVADVMRQTVARWRKEAAESWEV